MINPRWLELPLSRTNFHGPKGVRAIEVRLYIQIIHFSVRLKSISSFVKIKADIQDISSGAILLAFSIFVFIY